MHKKIVFKTKDLKKEKGKKEENTEIKAFRNY